MLHLSSWKTTDASVLAVLSSQVLLKFDQYRQCRPHDAEAGGVLLGCRRGKHFEVVHATQPFPSDARTRTGFSREALGHQQEAVDHWDRSQARVGYVGEWHTHPEGVPSASWLDKSEWKKLVRDRQLAPPLLAVIVGTATLYVALVKECGDIHPMVAAVR